MNFEIKSFALKIAWNLGLPFNEGLWLTKYIENGVFKKLINIIAIFVSNLVNFQKLKKSAEFWKGEIFLKLPVHFFAGQVSVILFHQGILSIYFTGSKWVPL